jgi:hypothetical protein
MGDRVHLFDALVAAATAFGSATRYRGRRVWLWCRETWKDEDNKTIIEMVAVVLIPIAFLLVFLLSY